MKKDDESELLRRSRVMNSKDPYVNYHRTRDKESIIRGYI